MEKTSLANSSISFEFSVGCLKQTGDIPVSVHPTSSSPAFSYFRYCTLTLPTDQPALKQTETISGPGCAPVEQ